MQAAGIEDIRVCYEQYNQSTYSERLQLLGR